MTVLQPDAPFCYHRVDALQAMVARIVTSAPSAPGMLVVTARNVSGRACILACMASCTLMASASYVY